MCSRKWIVRIGSLLLALCLVMTCFATETEGEEEIQLSATPLTNGLLEANSNRQIHPFETEVVISQFTTEGFKKIGETEEIAIYLNQDEAALRILNKQTGYIWGALPVEDAEGLNSTWRCYGNGLVSIECFNEEGVESRVSIGKNGSAEYEMIEDGLICSAYFEEHGIAFKVKVSWADNRLSMELVEGSLEEGLNDSLYTLKSMTFMPFLGSSYSDSIDGYILIPDGCGALIRYRQPANYSSTYASRIYGVDYGIASLASTAGNYSRAEAQILMPVYGMVHGVHQNGFLAVVDTGAEYASILATPAQKNNPYNWAAVRFEFRQKYVKNINRKEGAGANVPQEIPNAIMPKISFYFTEGEQANYDGMAILYRQMLIDQGILAPLEIDGSEMPLQLEVLGADKKENFLWDTTTVFTTTEQAEEIRESLEQHGIGNVDMVYMCYTKNNECGKGLLATVGKSSDFVTLRNSLEENGGSLYFYMDPITANEDQITLRTEAANNLSKMEIRWIEASASISSPYTYLYRLSVAEKLMEDAINREYGAEFALAEMSNKLYADYTTGKEITRDESLAEVLDLVSLVSSDGRIPMYQPNQYLWKFADTMYNMPATNSQIMYESDSVPFLQIVLSGCVEMFGNSINTSSYSTERLLRQIEYGMAPTFTVTGCESIELYNTNQESYFSSCYYDWEPRIVEAYDVVSDALTGVWGHSIVSHNCLATGIVCVEYDNGIQIYLNYTDKAATVNGITVESGWFTVVGGR